MLKESPFPSGIKPRVIIGLGNPKIQYDLTYHNVGILFINRIIKISNFSCEFTQKVQIHWTMVIIN